MNSDNSTLDLGPLPISDSNAELQRESVKALNALLKGRDELLLRDERFEDYGIDCSFELKLHGGMTNFRGQVQLKAKSKVEANQDGSISLSVATTNLNYLLNGVAPIYLLHDARADRFWYTWARDESVRLEVENKEWRKQSHVTLKFANSLTPETLSDIHERILTEGRCHRQIHDALAKATGSEPVIINIEKTSLDITNPTQARDVLLATGTAIVAAGFPQEVLRLVALLDSSSKNMARIRLASGYARFTIGEHYAAIGDLRIAQGRPQELSSRDRSFATTIIDAAEFHIGIISSDSYTIRLQVQAGERSGLEALEAKQSALYHRCVAEPDPRIRASIAQELSAATAQILNHDDADRGVRLDAKLVSLYVEGMQANFEMTDKMSSADIRSILFPSDLRTILTNLRDATAAEVRWEKLAQEALSEAYELRHPVLLVQALTVSLQVRIGRLLSRRLEAIDREEAYQVPSPILSAISTMLEEALAICDLNGSVESRLRLKKIEAEFLEIQNDTLSAKRVAAIAYPEADAMQFVAITRTLKEIIDDDSLIARYARQRESSRDEDPDMERARMSDDQLARMSRHVVEIIGSPPAHPRKVHGYMRTLRIIAQERCTWCRHIQLLEDLRQTSAAETAFSETPFRTAYCDKFSYRSEIGTVDVPALIEDFKNVYCTKCTSRSPKAC